MDTRTVMLMLATGSVLFGLLLVMLKFRKNNPQQIPYWIIAKFLQAAGSFMLFYKMGKFDWVAVLANIFLLLGCSYEAWTVLFISGKPIKRQLHYMISLVIVLVCYTTVFLFKPYRVGVLFLLQTIFYILPGIFLFRSHMRSFLRILLGVCYCITGTVFLLSAFLCFVSPEHALSLGQNPVFLIIPVVSFAIFLMSGFIMLMLAKEVSDIQVLEIKKNLEKSEVRFQRIIETTIEGILIFDENYKITFSNKKMASVLGYTIDEMLQRPYKSFFPESHLEEENRQENLRRSGQDSVYECCLLTKESQKHWFLVSANALINDAGEFEGSFAMLTDINERKEMELLLEKSNRQLTELSNKDGLTGIANRRCFDEVLEREYFRLKRSNSKLSIIMLDIDHFKSFNDNYGHVAGDDCLRQIGNVLAGCVSRSVDLAARYGGEEFACILPDTDLPAAVKIAEDIRQKIEELKIEHKESPVSKFITASFGVTVVQYSEERTLSDIVNNADKLLYKAKASGRNRIEYNESSK